MRKTKIVCTLGPASSSPETIEAMLKAGMDVARVNFSHGDHNSHGKTIDRFRQVRDKLGYAAAVMLDTKGPEIRTGNFKDGRVILKEGQTFTLTTEERDGDEQTSFITYAKLPEEVIRRFCADRRRKIRLEVKAVTKTEIRCIVKNGGTVSNHKGINVPNVKLNMEYLSHADREDILFGIEKDVD